MTKEISERMRGHGALMRQARKDAGMSMAEVGRRMGTARNTVKSWEDECTSVPLPKFLEFCEVTGADPVRMIARLKMQRRKEAESARRGGEAEFQPDGTGDHS